MAADLYLLDQASKRNCITLRLYRWRAPTITIGYMQKPTELLDLQALERHGAEWIRRPTGGRAVLHHQDVTYSCVFSRKIRRMGTTLASTYRLISRGLMRGLEIAGIACEPHDSEIDSSRARREVTLPCFLAPNREEIMVAGRKLVGSAQKRQGKAVLQHGSIPLTCAFRQLPYYQKAENETRRELLALLQRKCTCVAELLPTFTESEIMSALKQGFAEILTFEAFEEPWSGEELRDIVLLSESEEFKALWMS
ncbi:MAG: hypothetical protein GF344_12860 [Chitinivibrionales bacterium]|nr:hypothetical protein [Chitinivibrionales bacterium]